MSEIVDNNIPPNTQVEVLGVLSYHKNPDGSYSIQAIAGRSGLHVRPSVALYGVISKYGMSDVFINNSLIRSIPDIIALGLTGGVGFEIKLKGDFLGESDVVNFIQEVKDIEKPEVAGCESVPRALGRILGGKL